MITYTWSIAQLYTVEAFNTNYVVYAKWTVTGTDGTHTASFNSGTDFAVPTTQSDIFPYSNLTPDIVLGWVKEDLGNNGVNSIENNITEQINSLINPVLSPAHTALPWDK